MVTTTQSMVLAPNLLIFSYLWERGNSNNGKLIRGLLCLLDIFLTQEKKKLKVR